MRKILFTSGENINDICGACVFDTYCEELGKYPRIRKPCDVLGEDNDHYFKEDE